MHSKKELDKRLLEAGVNPLKKLGQNFLVNEEICKRIVGAVESARPTAVVEIGPGLGALTDEILQGSWRTKLVELDAGLVEYWKKRAPQSEIIHADALKVNWDSESGLSEAALVSNLPYSIAASLVIDLSVAKSKPFRVMILMFQKEVAQKMAATVETDDYGIPSVIAQTFWTIERVVDAGPQDFHPVPNVGSRVLKFTRKGAGAAPADAERFLELVKVAFSQRRKKLFSNLGSFAGKDEIQSAFDKLGLDPNVRAQELTPARFAELFASLTSKNQ